MSESAFDPKHPYFDEKSNRDKPKWEVVHVEFRHRFDDILTLETLKSHAKAGGPLENLQTLRQSRVSVSSVTPNEWRFIMNLLGEAGLEEADGNAPGETVTADGDQEPKIDHQLNGALSSTGDGSAPVAPETTL